MRSLLNRILVRLPGNQFAQSLLERNVLASHYMMGIGAGGDVRTSGEFALIRHLIHLHPHASRPLMIFDVGANQGQFWELLQNEFRAKAFVYHGFEPSRKAYRDLVERVGTAQDVHLNNCGLGRTAEKAMLYYDQAGSGLASLSRRKLEHFGIAMDEHEEIDLDSLDHYCEENQIDAIDLLKIDVDGHELDVLHGAERMFAQSKIRMLSFEFGGANIDTRTYFQDFWYWLHSHGMNRFFRISPAGYLVPLPKYRELDERFLTTNFLVLPGPQPY